MYIYIYITPDFPRGNAPMCGQWPGEWVASGSKYGHRRKGPFGLIHVFVCSQSLHTIRPRWTSTPFSLLGISSSKFRKSHVVPICSNHPIKKVFVGLVFTGSIRISWGFFYRRGHGCGGLNRLKHKSINQKTLKHDSSTTLPPWWFIPHLLPSHSLR